MNDDEVFQSGLFRDDGTRINPELVSIPPLCLTCQKNGLGGEECILCTLNRADQEGEEHFECGAYETLPEQPNIPEV